MATSGPSNQIVEEPANLVLFLGGSSKKHNYLRKYFEEYSDGPIECKNLRTKACHENGPAFYKQEFEEEENKKIIAVCPLMDSLIPFTDTLNAACKLPGNEAKTSEIRRNKAKMHQTIEEKTKSKVRFGKFFLINDYLTDKDKFDSNLKNDDLSYPIVIKPPTSGGTDGVRLCHSFEAAQKVVKTHLNKENGEKNVNVSMMAQEFLDGEEYVVNSVSYESNHRFTDVWRAHKSFHVDKNYANDENENESKEDEKCYPYSMSYDYQQFERDIIKNSKMQMIVKYVENILNVLGVKYGCAHCEVMYLPKENKVCLIELNARMHGGLPRAAQLVKYDQMSALALSHCNPKRFLSEIPKYYAMNSEENDDEKVDDSVTVRAVFLKSSVDGRMNFAKLIELENSLKSFKFFARTLHDQVKYWKHYTQEAIAVAEQLEKMTDVEEENKCMIYEAKLNRALAIVDNIENEYAKVKKTIDLISCPGTIVLEGKLTDIEMDYATIRALENDSVNGLFIMDTE